MTDPIDQILIEWHKWSSRDFTGLDYRSQSTVGKLYRASRQYDDENGALDAEIDHGYMEHVDAIISEIANPYRIALGVAARNLVAGRTVFKSPLLPQEVKKRAQITIEAKSMLSKRLKLEP